jgi:tyrosyl-tRNA synthetase
MTAAEQTEAITAGAANAFPLDELRTRLATGRRLRVKLGVDPTAPDIHLGHTVALTKLRRCQDLGHQAVLIIGDYTARIGDPSGRSVTRPPLSTEEIERFAATYETQVFKLTASARRFVATASGSPNSARRRPAARPQMTSRMLERDDFSNATPPARHRTARISVPADAG